jgi:hypothetical protein
LALAFRLGDRFNVLGILFDLFWRWYQLFAILRKETAPDDR